MSRIGERIAGRYLCQELLGKGGMGEVYLVLDELEPNRRVALKLLRRDGLRPEWLDQLRSEFSALARLHHPGLVEVYQFDLEPGTGLPFFTLEALRGASLLHTPEARRPERLVELAAQILRSLSFLHSEGYLHYDLKPSNIFVTEAGVTKLLDFALAGTAGQSDRHKGTPNYSAPEMIRRESVDQRLDLYSLGATLYHMLSGHAPFGGGLNDVLRGHLYRAPAPLALPEEHRPFERFILRLLAKRPEDRYISANHALEELGRLCRLDFGALGSASRGAYLPTSKLLGRERELEILQAPLAALQSPTVAPGRTVLVLLSGESGMGKSRLLREVELEAQLQGIRITDGHCIPRRVLPLQALREALRAPALDAGNRFPDLLESYRPELAHFLPFLGAPERVVPPKALISRLTRFLLEYSTRQSLVLHAGDLQWADEATVSMLELLVQRLGREPGRYRMAVYASYRPAESLQGAWGPAVQRLLQKPGARLVELKPLTPREVERMIGSMLGEAKLAPVFAVQIANLTQGHPLYIEETIRYLLDKERLVRKAEHFELEGNLADLVLPTTFAAIVENSLAALAPSQIQLLQALAVLGRPAEAGLLERVLGIASEELRQLSRGLLRKHFLTRSWAEGEYLFALRHDQFGQLFYERLEPQGRAELHARIAEALQARLPGQGLSSDVSASSEIALHYAEGIDARAQDRDYLHGAFQWCERAGRLAIESVSYHQALEILRRAQRLAKLGGTELLKQFMDATLLLIEVLERLGDDDRLQLELEQAEALLRNSAQ